MTLHGPSSSSVQIVQLELIGPADEPPLLGGQGAVLAGGSKATTIQDAFSKRKAKHHADN